MTKLILCCVAMVAVAGSAQAADKTAGQGHARKANSLAAAGKCKQAIPEYNRAYSVLRDPALLFNRAECLRKVGKREEALYDYRRFLEELPEAPNRRMVESRIAALDPGAGAVATKTILQMPVSQEAPAVVAAPAPVLRPQPAPSPSSLRPAGMRQPMAMAASPSLPPPGLREAAQPPMVSARRPPPEAPSSDGRAWIWLSVAAAVVAASAAGALYVAGRPRNQ